MQDKIAVDISMPKKIMKRLDIERGDIPRSRFLLRILEKQYLDRGTKEGLLDRRIENTPIKPSNQ